MFKEFMLPDLGEGIVECELVEWLVKEGDLVVEDQPIADVMTDKALVQIPAVHPGCISKLYYKVGELARVGAPLFAIEIEQAVVADSVANAVEAIATEVAEKVVETPEAGALIEVSEPQSGKAVASPAVRRMARELGVNIAEVPGSGEKGRVYKEDLFAYSGNSSVSALPGQLARVTGQGESSHKEPLRGVQAAMAKQMSLSVTTIAHFTMSDQIDLTELTAMKRALAAEIEQPKLTLMPFMIKALSVALAEFPILNSHLHEEPQEIEFFHHHHIGVAVDTPQGLLVPVLRHVEDSSVLSLAHQLSELLADARAGKLSRAQLSGSTFTVSNVGAIGGTTATPIINYPESAILAVGRIQRLPRFDANDKVVARQIADISWSADHRIIDGATMAKFSNRFIQLLQQPSNLLINLR
ncbi:2-oxo acid dehydrogenase subunit E2 [Corallincola spongiicola]|uniref:Dihydrolipoamide acetyltransferase component of pyruvate dehydrogenase complex n=1 Tax=Corallincola spongiicola TaxID=2520508 RepID=A0ABY1WUU9_9GAMM|nr:2-oxo acid dehydrogenase subunit E2 [Corallincola spongiicola]TAA48530.1 dihydrolipoyllysine-residue acetyltransferase [Corallincola spongiicola]